MRVQVLVTAALFASTAAQSHAQTVSDSSAWLEGVTEIEHSSDAAWLRWRVNTSSAASVPILLTGERDDVSEISAVSGQVDIHPFGDEFFLSAGTISPRGDRAIPAWMRQPDSPASMAFPHAELSEELSRSNIDALTRYFGAGITVRTIDAWSVTMEGGAYFQDTSEDQMILFDPETGEHMPLLEDLDRMDAEAIGESQSRSVRPVAHLVLRRRF
ncbi:hypothetical protein [Maricaulis sp.]|uniref:hypothetical protein n=1 Tax=Maricaulis sp. TaxID=1486257 RepID=UPI002B276C98|nr:hypothetical protein [Maricaulis sp.]